MFRRPWSVLPITGASVNLAGFSTFQGHCVAESAVNIERVTESVEALKAEFEAYRYICSDQISTAVYLAYHLRKPVLIEGPPGVGKTELGKTAAAMLGLPLIRLQCYEGLDEAKAIYEWKYGKQLLYTQVLKETLDEVLQGARGFAESEYPGCTSSAISFSPRSSWSRDPF